MSETTTTPPDQLDDLFERNRTFEDLGLNPQVLKGVEAMGYVHPTHVQVKLIEVALKGKDILGQSKTGTGKTAAFGLPLIHLLQEYGEDKMFGGLVLCPTRELAVQVAHELRNLGRFTKLKILPVYGGQRMNIQAPKLQKGANIIVGTPGRIMDFHRRGLLPYDQLRVAILDEVDRMLDIGFREDIRKILGSIRQKHQTIFVSATISSEIDRLARSYLHEPEKLVLTASSLTVSQVDQKYLSAERWDKNRLLVHLLKEEKPGLALIFCRTKQTVDGLTEYLNRKGIDAHAIHGDMYQGKRNRVMTQLRQGELSVLVASDLAARGLDVDDISHVINYDIPEDAEMYVHRIGRTARAGRRGIAWSLVTPDQGELLTNIEILTNVQIELVEYSNFKPGPVPKDVIIKRERQVAETEAYRQERARVRSGPPPKTEAVDPTRFPGGIVPSEVPAKRLGGRLRTKRTR